AGAAGGGAHLEDLRECGLALIGVEGVVERVALSKYLGGEVDELVERELGGFVRARTLRRRELERAHAALAGVAQALDRVEAITRTALRRQPRIDQGIAELIRQAVC